MIGIFSKNREEWITLDIAGWLYNLTLSPLYDTLGSDTIYYCIEHSNFSTIVISSECLNKIFKLEKLPASLKTIVALDKVTDD